MFEFKLERRKVSARLGSAQSFLIVRNYNYQNKMRAKILVAILGTALASNPLNKCYQREVFFTHDAPIDPNAIIDGYYGFHSDVQEGQRTYATAGSPNGPQDFFCVMDGSYLIKSLYVVNRDTQDAIDLSEIDLSGKATVQYGTLDGNQLRTDNCVSTLTKSGWYRCGKTGTHIGMMFTDTTAFYLSEFMAYTQVAVQLKVTEARWIKVKDSNDAANPVEIQQVDSADTLGPLQNYESQSQRNSPYATDQNYFEARGQYNGYMITLHMTYKIDAVIVFAAEPIDGGTAVFQNSEDLLVMIYNDDTFVGQCQRSVRSYAEGAQEPIESPFYTRYQGIQQESTMYLPEFVCSSSSTAGATAGSTAGGQNDAGSTVVGLVGNKVVLGRSTGSTLGFRSIRVMADMGDTDNECDCGTATIPALANIETYAYTLDDTLLVNGKMTYILATPEFQYSCASNCYELEAPSASIPELKDHSIQLNTDSLEVEFQYDQACEQDITEGDYIYYANLKVKYTNPEGQLAENAAVLYPILKVSLSYKSCAQTTWPTFDLYDSQMAVVITQVALSTDLQQQIVKLTFPTDTTTAHFTQCYSSGTPTCAGDRSVLIQTTEGGEMPTAWTVVLASNIATITIPYSNPLQQTQVNYSIYAKLVISSTDSAQDGVTVQSATPTNLLVIEEPANSCSTTTLNAFVNAGTPIEKILTHDNPSQPLIVDFPTDTVSVTQGTLCSANRQIQILDSAGADVTTTSGGSQVSVVVDPVTNQYTFTYTFLESGANTVEQFTIQATYDDGVVAPQTQTKSLQITMQTQYNCELTGISAPVSPGNAFVSPSTPTEGISKVFPFPDDKMSLIRVAAGFVPCTDSSIATPSFRILDEFNNIIADQPALTTYTNNQCTVTTGILESIITTIHVETYEDKAYQFQVMATLYFETSRSTIESPTTAWIATTYSMYDCSRTSLSAVTTTPITVTVDSSPQVEQFENPTDSVSALRASVTNPVMSSCTGTQEIILYQEDSSSLVAYDWLTSAESIFTLNHDETGEDIVYTVLVAARLSFTSSLGNPTVIQSTQPYVQWLITQQTQYNCAETVLQAFTLVDQTVELATTPVSYQLEFPADTISTQRTSLSLSECAGTRYFEINDTETGAAIDDAFITQESGYLLSINHIETGSDYEQQLTVYAKLFISPTLHSQEATFEVTTKTQFADCAATVLDQFTLPASEIVLDYTSTQSETMQLAFPSDSNSVPRLNYGLDTGCEGTRVFTVLDSTGVEITLTSSGAVVYDSTTEVITVSYVSQVADSTDVYTVWANLTTSDGTVIAPVSQQFTVTLQQQQTAGSQPQLLRAISDLYEAQLGEQVDIQFTVYDPNLQEFDLSLDMGGADGFGSCKSNELDTGVIQVLCSFTAEAGDQDIGEQFTVTVTLEQDDWVSEQHFDIKVALPDEEEIEDEEDDEVDEEDEDEEEEDIEFEVPFEGWTPPSSSFETFREPLKVKRSNITATGLVTIEYNQIVETKIEYLALEYEQLSDNSDIDFSYNVTHNEKNFVKIQLYFTRPLLVSSGWEPDIIQVYIPITVVDNERRLSSLEFLKVEMQVPGQVKDANEQEELIQSKAVAATVAGSAFWLYIVLALLLKGVMGMLWGLFQALQLMTSFPLLLVKVPTNVLTIQSGFIEMINMEIVSKDQVYDYTFGKILSEEEEVQYNSTSDDGSKSHAREELGFQDTNMLKQMVLIIIGVIVFLQIVCCIVLLWKFAVPRLSPALKKIVHSIKGKIMYNTILRTSIQSYLSVGITSLYTLQEVGDKGATDVIVMVLMLLFVFLWPALSYKVVQRKEKQLQEQEVKTSIGTLYLNQDTMKVKSCKDYHMWFMYRRLVFGLTIVFLTWRTPMLQIGLTAHLSVYVLAYLLIRMPMAKTHHNWLAVFNEATVYCSCVFLVIFTDFVPSPEVRHELGYSYLNLIYFFVGVNMIMMLIDLILKLVRSYRKRQALKRHKKQVEEKKKASEEKQNQSIHEHQLEFEQPPVTLLHGNKRMIVDTRVSTNATFNTKVDSGNPSVIGQKVTGAHKVQDSYLSGESSSGRNSSSYVFESSYDSQQAGHSESFNSDSSVASKTVTESYNSQDNNSRGQSKSESYATETVTDSQESNTSKTVTDSYYTTENSKSVVESDQYLTDNAQQLESLGEIAEQSKKAPNILLISAREDAQWPATPSDRSAAMYNNSMLMPRAAQSSLHLESGFFPSQQSSDSHISSEIRKLNESSDIQFFSQDGQDQNDGKKSYREITMTSSQLVREVLDKSREAGGY